MNNIKLNDFIHVEQLDHLFLIEKIFSGIYTARSVADLSTWFKFYYHIRLFEYVAFESSEDIHEILYVNQNSIIKIDTIINHSYIKN